MHCVRVLLTRTTMAAFVAYGSMVGIVLCTVTYSCVQYCGLLGAPLSLVVMGPHPGNVAKHIWCEVVASTDGASAHTAHFLSTTQMSCVLTTIYCKSSVAAGACPTESMEVAETRSDSTHGVPNVPRHAELKTSVDYNTGMASKNNQ